MSDQDPRTADVVAPDASDHAPRYDQFFLLSPGPMCIADLSGSYTRVNPAFVRLTGYEERELLGRNYLEFIPPEDRQKTAEDTKLRAAQRPSLESESRFVCRDGSIIQLSWTSYVDSTEGVAYATARDITQLRKAEAALRESEERFRAIFEQAAVGVAMTDSRTGRLISVNQRMCDIARLTREQLMAATFMDITHPDDLQTDLDCMEKLRSGGLRTFAMEKRYLHADGEVTWVNLTVSPMWQPGEEPTRHVAVMEDITERKRAQFEREQLGRKMQETQKLESLGVLAGGIAHDFNNLLTGIMGNASMASMHLPKGSPLHDYLDPITKASLRAADLCRQMLAYSGGGRFFVQRLDLGGVVEETTDMLHLSISKKAELRFHLESGLPPVVADATQLHQVVMNLVINASEAIGDRGGVIRLSTGLARLDRDGFQGALLAPEVPADRYVFLDISDDGCGMSPDTQAKMFDPFFTTKFVGRGLGLAAVLGIVRGHKGALTVTSEVGRGTTFRLFFPAAAGASESSSAVPARPVAVQQWKGTGTVLVVDDEETVRSAIATMLTFFGFDPVLASDGQEAADVFGSDPGRFALVMLDLTMPQMDGRRAFVELQRCRPDVRVILMSGFSQKDALARFPGKGPEVFLQKPFALESLRDVLQRVLASPGRT